MDYELESFAAGTGSAASLVRVQATSLDMTNYGSITFEATPEGRSVVGWFNRGEQRRAFERARGRIRIERVGTTLRLALAGPSGWDALVERSHVDTAFDLVFTLVVESPADSGGVVAAFDNLRVSSIRAR